MDSLESPPPPAKIFVLFCTLLYPTAPQPGKTRNLICSSGFLRVLPGPFRVHSGSAYELFLGNSECDVQSVCNVSNFRVLPGSIVKTFPRSEFSPQAKKHQFRFASHQNPPKPTANRSSENRWVSVGSGGLWWVLVGFGWQVPKKPGKWPLLEPDIFTPLGARGSPVLVSG